MSSYPKDWQTKKLKELSSKIGSGITPRGGSSTYHDEGIPLIRSQNIPTPIVKTTFQQS